MHRLRFARGRGAGEGARRFVLTGRVVGGLLSSDARGEDLPRVRWTSMVTELEEVPMSIVGVWTSTGSS